MITIVGTYYDYQHDVWVIMFVNGLIIEEMAAKTIEALYQRFERIYPEVSL